MNARVSFRLFCLFWWLGGCYLHAKIRSCVHIVSRCGHFNKLDPWQGQTYSKFEVHTRRGYFILVEAISYSQRLFHIRRGYFIFVEAISYSQRLFHTRRGYFILVEAISYSQTLFHTRRGYFILIEAILMYTF